MIKRSTNTSTARVTKGLTQSGIHGNTHWIKAEHIPGAIQVNYLTKEYFFDYKNNSKNYNNVSYNITYRDYSITYIKS